MLSEIGLHEIDPNTLPHASQTIESVNILREDIKDKLERKKPNEFETDTCFALKGKDFTDQTRVLFDVLDHLEDKKDISSTLAEAFKSSFYEIFNTLDASQQEIVDLARVEPFFGFLDDSFLTQTDDFIKQMDRAVRAVVQFLETTEPSDEVKKIGEVLVTWGKISKGDHANALNKQKPLGQILLEDKKIGEKDLKEALAD